MAIGRVFVCSVPLLYLLSFSFLLGQKCNWNRSSNDPILLFTNSVPLRVNPALGNQLRFTSKYVRHLVSAPRGRRYFASRTCYYANSDSSFQHNRLLTSGDVSLNPGPCSNPPKCSVCSRTVARNHRALNCDLCEKWCHIRCGNVKPSDYKNLQRLTTFDWSCPRCLQTNEIIANSFRNETILTPVTATTNNNTERTESREDPFLVLKQSVGNKNLKIGHLNINGLVNKLCEV